MPLIGAHDVGEGDERGNGEGDEGRDGEEDERASTEHISIMTRSDELNLKALLKGDSTDTIDAAANRLPTRSTTIYPIAPDSKRKATK